MKSRFVNIVRNRTLKFYVVPQQSLREFSADKRRYVFDSMPDEQYRVTSEEMEPTSDVEYGNMSFEESK